MKRKISLIILGVLAVLGVLILATKTRQKEKILIKIGMVGPLSGEAATYGIEARNGVQLAISLLNQKQTRFRFELVAKDDQADPSLAEKAARELVVEKDVLAVVGPITSGATLAAGEIFQKNRLPAITPSATSPKISELGDFIFRVCPSDTFQGKAAAEFVVQDLGFDQIAILWDSKNEAYSGGLAEAFRKRAEELGAKITGVVSYQAGQKEFTQELEKLKATEPKVIYIPGYYTDVALIAQQIQKMGWQIPIVGGDGLYSPELIALGGKAVEGIKFTSFFISSDPQPKVQDFVRAYKEMFGTEPGWIAAHAFDAMNVIAKAIEIGGTSREGIQKGLTKIENFEGVSGVISFDENGDVLKDILKLEVKEGNFEIWSR